MRIGSRCASVFLGVLAVVAAPSTAHAVPDECTITISGHSASSFCASGTGEHQIRVKFDFVLPDPTIDDMWFYGQWAAVGATSETYIPLGGTVVHREVAKR